MQRKLLLTTTLLFSFFFSYSQAITDSTIAMIAFWDKGDMANYKCTYTESTVKDGAKSNSKQTKYDMLLNVVDATADSYTIEANYKNHQHNYEMEGFEKDLFEICKDLPLLYKTDEFGVYEKIINWEESKNLVDKAFDKFIAEKGAGLPDSINNAIKNMIQGMYGSEEQMSFLMSETRVFHFLYGANLSRTIPHEGVRLYTNPFLKTMMPGYQKVTVVEVDEKDWIAEVKIEAGIEGDVTKDLMVDFLKNNMENMGIKDIEEIKRSEMPEFSVKEEYNFIYDIETGYIFYADYSKLVTANGDSKLTTNTFELSN